MSKGGGKQQTVTQDNSPWKGVQPYLTDLFSRAQAQSYGTGISPTTSALQTRLINASQGTPAILGTAEDQLSKTLSGGYLNPYTSGAMGDAMDMAKAKINAQFSGDNYGSSAHQEWLGRGITAAGLPFAQQAFENERGRQLQAAGMSPVFANQDLARLGTGLSVSQGIDDAPWNQLLRYQQAISGSGGGTSTTTQPMQKANPIGSALGGGLAGASLASALPALGLTGPWGFALGAGLGLLGS